MKYLKGIFILLIGMMAMTANGQQRFIENGGQWPEQVYFKTDIPGGSLYLESNKLLFDRYDTETADAVFSGHSGNPNHIAQPAHLQCHAYSMTFNGAILSELPIGKKKSKTKYSYFKGQDPNKWGENLKGYEEIIYVNAYTNIDFKIYRNATLKYDFIIKSGGNPEDIEIEYDGVKPKLNEKGQLIVQTVVGEVLESKPFAYQIIDGHITQVGCDYVLSGRKVKFVLAPYRLDLDLIIDPELIFSTYSGSTSDNFGYTATYSTEGHLFSGSSAFGTGYPTSTGAYQTDWAGGEGAGTAGTDIAITKFSLDGTDIEYSTYLGGTGDDLPHSLIADEDGSLYILGTTGSDDFPLSDDAYQSDFLGGAATSLGGIGVSYPNGADIIVAKLDPAGANLLGSTYLGGDENDGVNTSNALSYNYADEVRGEIELEPSGNIVIGSSTHSDNFPVPASAFQPTKDSNQEGIIVEMSADLSTLISATFFGGNGDDAIYSIHSTQDGFITVAGGTVSDNLPSSDNAYQTDFAGGAADGFIAVFPSGLNAIISMTYFGSSAYDQIYFVDRDEAGNPHILGQTEAPDDTFIFQADYSVPNSGMLVAKFNPLGTDLIWSTVFGDGDNVPNLSPTAFSVDICNRVYLSGWGGGPNPEGSTDGLPVTEDAFQSDTDGNDFYFMVLEGDASDITFASFFGGGTSSEHVDGGTSRFDRTGKIYQAVCAGCGSNDDFPTEPDNVWSSVNGSSNCNLGVAKIDFDLPLVFADFEYTSDCLPNPTLFDNTSSTYSGSSPNYQWIFPNGDILNGENASYVFDEAGIFDVKLVITDINACNLTDTIVKPVEVFPEIELEIDDQYTSCITNEFEIIALNNESGTYFEWSENGNFTNIILEGATDSILNYTTDFQHDIYLRISNEHCNIVDTILISPAPTMLLSTTDTLICVETEFSLSLTLAGGSEITSIIWSPEEKILSGQGTENVVFIAITPFLAEVFVTTEFGCDLIEAVQVDVFPTYLEVSQDTLACEDQPITLGANSFGSAQDFTWSNQPDFSIVLNPGGDSTISVTPTSIQFYYILVENNGCFLKDSVAVSLLSAGTTVSPDQFICLGDTANLFVSNDFPGNDLMHSWEPDEYIVSGQNTSYIRVLVDDPTTFTVLSETGEGCIVENSSTVFLSPLGGMEVEAFGDPLHLIVGESSLLTVLPIDDEYIYQWTPATYLSNPNGTTTISTPNETITYLVTIMDYNDMGVCAKSDSVTIFIYDHKCGEPNIFVPNTFTPNGDGENDELWARGGNITKLDFSIYNRWGEKVFETADQSQGWDGTYKGDLAEPNVYVYYLTVECEEGEEFFKKGNVTLLR